jgi:hypothetical protein
MNKLTIFPLFFNFIVFFFFIIFGEKQWVSIGNIAGIDVGFWVDSTFAIYAFVGLLTAIVFLGLHIIGNGFSDRSLQLVLELVSFVAVWALTSLFTFSIFNSIPIFGWIIWALLTISYAVGVFLDISLEGDENV